MKDNKNKELAICHGRWTCKNLNTKKCDVTNLNCCFYEHKEELKGEKVKVKIQTWLVCNNCGKRINIMSPYNCCSKKCAKEYLKKCKKAGKWI